MKVQLIEKYMETTNSKLNRKYYKLRNFSNDACTFCDEIMSGGKFSNLLLLWEKGVLAIIRAC